MPISTINHTCELSDAVIFRSILNAADPYWEKQDGRKDLYFMPGNLLAWGEIWVIAFLAYNPESYRIHLHSVVADMVFRMPDRFDAFIFRPGVICGRLQGRYDPENYVIVVESNCKCPPDKEKIPETVKTLFTGFKSMLNNKLLYAVLRAAKVHFRGVPADVFERE